MTSIADSSVKIQASSESIPSPPSWFGEVVLLISSLRKQGVLAAISSQVRFARRRFGRYEVIDFLALRNIARKWTMPIHYWKPALNWFAIEFAGRFPH